MKIETLVQMVLEAQEDKALTKAVKAILRMDISELTKLDIVQELLRIWDEDKSEPSV